MRIATMLVLLLALLAGVPTPTTARSGATPGEPVLVSDDGYGVELGDPAAPTAIDLYVDPSCPHSGTLMEADGAQLRALIDAGTLFLTLRPMNFLDRADRDYSSRVDNALFLAAADPATTPAALLTFLQTLYQRLPDTRAQMDDLALAGTAGETGLPPGVVVGIAARTPGVDTAAMGPANRAALKAVSPDQVGVPTVYDRTTGRVLDTDPGWLDALVN